MFRQTAVAPDWQSNTPENSIRLQYSIANLSAYIQGKTDKTRCGQTQSQSIDNSKTRKLLTIIFFFL